jgi:hypothetical protein
MWKQGSEELNELVGSVTVTAPPASECGYRNGIGVAHLLVRVDGNEVGFLPDVPADGNELRLGVLWEVEVLETVPFADNGFLLEPGATTNHTLKVEARDLCGIESSKTAGHFTIDSLSIDVIGVK